MPDPNSFPTYGDITATYAAIGRAISNWARVEQHLFSLFSAVIGEEDPIAGPLFFAWRDLKGRLDVTHNVIIKRLPGAPELAYWGRLLSITRALATERNFIAHNPATLSLDEQGARYGQVTGFYEAKHGGKKRVVKMAPEIERVADTFTLLADEYLGFCLHVNGQRPSPDGFALPVSDPILASYDNSRPREPKPPRQRRPSPP